MCWRNVRAALADDRRRRFDMEIWLARHGATEWTVSKQHTGSTDLPLIPEGEEDARHLGERLAGVEFATVMSSPLQRARETAPLAGFPDVRGNELPREGDYGEYE